MTRKSEPPVFIRLSPLQVKKIEVMRESLDAPVTRKELIDDLIDGGYMGALKTLYDDGRITKRNYQDCLKLVPDYLKGDI
jgi:hypothetical protein